MPDATPEMRQWFAEFVREHYADVCRLCHAICISGGLGAAYAEDMTQDVFLTARRRLVVLYKHPEAKKWLYKAVYHIGDNAKRRMRSGKRRYAFSLDEENAPDLGDGYAEYKRLAALLDRDELAAAVRGLLPRDRLLFEQIYRMDMSLKELAGEYGLSDAAIQKRVQRMHARVRKNISEEI